MLAAVAVPDRDYPRRIPQYRSSFHGHEIRETSTTARTNPLFAKLLAVAAGGGVHETAAGSRIQNRVLPISCWKVTVTCHKLMIVGERAPQPMG